MGGERTFPARGRGVLPSLATAMAVVHQGRDGRTARQVAGSTCSPSAGAATRVAVSGFFTLCSHGRAIGPALLRRLGLGVPAAAASVGADAWVGAKIRTSGSWKNIFCSCDILFVFMALDAAQQLSARPVRMQAPARRRRLRLTAARLGSPSLGK